MCKASIVARYTRDARLHDRLRLGVSEHALPFFHQEGDSDGVVSCVKHGQLLELGNIPLEAQRRLGISSTVLAEFVEEPDDVSDQVKLLDGRTIDLWELFPPDADLEQLLGSISEITAVVGGSESLREQDDGDDSADTPHSVRDSDLISA